MTGFILEQRPLLRMAKLADDLTHHLQCRYALGMTVIVADRPMVFLSMLRKSWIKAEASVRRQMASTLDTRRLLLLRESERMAAVHFKRAETLTEASVVLIGPESTIGLPRFYTTLYILCPVSEEYRKILEGRLTSQGLIVEYYDEQ